MSASTVTDVIPSPTEFLEVFNVQGGTPVGLRLHVTDNRITMLDPNSALVGKAFVGDRVIAVDGEPVKTSKELMKKIKENKKPKVPLTIKHANWSWCSHRCTTVERILMDKDNDKLTGRAINIYQITIKVSRTPEIEMPQISLAVRYDARERLQVTHVDPNSITAVHIRPGDIIREVNDMQVASKTMLRYHMLTSAQKEGTVRLIIESAAGSGDSFRDTIEMAADVVAIAAKHVEELKKKTPFPKDDCLKKPAKPKNRRVDIATNERQTFDIASDCDITKLRSCKGAKQ